MWMIRGMVLLSVVFVPGTVPAHSQDRADARQEVMAVERAFARTMAERDHAAFAQHIAEAAVFFGSQGSVLRGREAVSSGWKRFFEEPEAPFSWEPEHVEVLPSGDLAFSSGPVYGADGSPIGTFNSVWRLEDDGRWRVVFDKGCPPCP